MRLLHLLWLSALGCAVANAAQTDEAIVSDAVVFQSYLISLNSQGSFKAWKLDDFSVQPSFGGKLRHSGLTKLAIDGDDLWASDSARVYKWDPAGGTWKAAGTFKPQHDETQALVISDGRPLLIFESRILSPVDGKNFRVPKLKGTFESERKLRVLSVFSTSKKVWIGTGNGEWGGELIRFSPQDGAWRDYFDALHYVTGITSSVDDLIVSWSMSHFMAETMIRIHGVDCKPVKEYPELRSKYYEQIAYNHFDNTLYGIESDQLVVIKEGRPVNPVKLTGRLYEREPNAIGVAPGIVKIFPIAERTLIVVPKRGVPLLIRDSKVTELRE